MDKSLHPFVAELVGTFTLVFVCGAAVCAAYLPTLVPIDVTGIALAQGLILAVTLTITLSASGGFLNPAVTITLWVLRRLDGRKALWLLGAQLLASLLAGLALRLIFSDVVYPYAVPHLMESLRSGAYELSPTQMATGAGVELILTFLLTFVIFGTMIDPRTTKLSSLGLGLLTGLAMVALTLVGFRLTGASLNPARAFGPYLWEWTVRATDYKEHVFVYWIAPIVGALAGGLVYSKLILPAESPAPAAAPPPKAKTAKAKK